MSDQKPKDSGPGFFTTAVIVGVAIGGYHYFKDPPKAPEHKLTRAEIDEVVAKYIPKPEPQDATGRCLDALGGNCIEKPCPVIQATQIVASKGIQRADSEDIAHSTLVEVCLKATDAEGPREWTQALMWRAQRRRIDYARRSARTCSFDAAIDANRSLRALAPEVNDRDVSAAMCEVGETDRCVLVARYWEDLDDATIAAKCGVGSTAMVRKQLERARARLKAALTKPLPSLPPSSGFRPPPSRRWQGAGSTPFADESDDLPRARWVESAPTESPPVPASNDNDDD